MLRVARRRIDTPQPSKPCIFDFLSTLLNVGIIFRNVKPISYSVGFRLYSLLANSSFRQSKLISLTEEKILSEENFIVDIIQPNIKRKDEIENSIEQSKKSLEDNIILCCKSASVSSLLSLLNQYSFQSSSVSATRNDDKMKSESSFSSFLDIKTLLLRQILPISIKSYSSIISMYLSLNQLKVAFELFFYLESQHPITSESSLVKVFNQLLPNHHLRVETRKGILMPPRPTMELYNSILDYLINLDFDTEISQNDKIDMIVQLIQLRDLHFNLDSLLIFVKRGYLRDLFKKYRSERTFDPLENSSDNHCTFTSSMNSLPIGNLFYNFWKKCFPILDIKPSSIVRDKENGLDFEVRTLQHLTRLVKNFRPSVISQKDLEKFHVSFLTEFFRSYEPFTQFKKPEETFINLNKTLANLLKEMLSHQNEVSFSYRNSILECIFYHFHYLFGSLTKGIYAYFKCTDFISPGDIFDSISLCHSEWFQWLMNDGRFFQNHIRYSPLLYLYIQSHKIQNGSIYFHEFLQSAVASEGILDGKCFVWLLSWCTSQNLLDKVTFLIEQFLNERNSYFDKMSFTLEDNSEIIQLLFFHKFIDLAQLVIEYYKKLSLEMSLPAYHSRLKHFAENIDRDVNANAFEECQTLLIYLERRGISFTPETYYYLITLFVKKNQRSTLKRILNRYQVVEKYIVTQKIYDILGTLYFVPGIERRTPHLYLDEMPPTVELFSMGKNKEEMEDIEKVTKSMTFFFSSDFGIPFRPPIQFYNAQLFSIWTGREYERLYPVLEKMSDKRAVPDEETLRLFIHISIDMGLSVEKDTNLTKKIVYLIFGWFVRRTNSHQMTNFVQNALLSSSVQLAPIHIFLFIQGLIKRRELDVANTFLDNLHHSRRNFSPFIKYKNVPFIFSTDADLIIANLFNSLIRAYLIQQHNLIAAMSIVDKLKLWSKPYMSVATGNWLIKSLLEFNEWNAAMSFISVTMPALSVSRNEGTLKTFIDAVILYDKTLISQSIAQEQLFWRKGYARERLNVDYLQSHPTQVGEKSLILLDKVLPALFSPKDKIIQGSHHFNFMTSGLEKWVGFIISSISSLRGQSSDLSPNFVTSTTKLLHFLLNRMSSWILNERVQLISENWATYLHEYLLIMIEENPSLAVSLLIKVWIEWIVYVKNSPLKKEKTLKPEPLSSVVLSADPGSIGKMNQFLWSLTGKMGEKKNVIDNCGSSLKLLFQIPMEITKISNDHISRESLYLQYLPHFHNKVSTANS